MHEDKDDEVGHHHYHTLCHRKQDVPYRQNVHESGSYDLSLTDTQQGCALPYDQVHGNA